MLLDEVLTGHHEAKRHATLFLQSNPGNESPRLGLYESPQNYHETGQLWQLHNVNEAEALGLEVRRLHPFADEAEAEESPVPAACDPWALHPAKEQEALLGVSQHPDRLPTRDGHQHAPGRREWVLSEDAAGDVQVRAGRPWGWDARGRRRNRLGGRGAYAGPARRDEKEPDV